jgi:hypothetical protein
VKYEELAFKRTIPFCYGCYKEAPTGKCAECGSDDLMRLLPGVGVEYGTSWVIEHILKQELDAVDVDEAFENSLRDCYPETTTIGFLQNYDTVSAMKELDPVAWRCAQSEWVSNQESEGIILSFDSGSKYYFTAEIENLAQ